MAFQQQNYAVMVGDRGDHIVLNRVRRTVQTLNANTRPNCTIERTPAAGSIREADHDTICQADGLFLEFARLMDMAETLPQSDPHWILTILEVADEMDALIEKLRDLIGDEDKMVDLPNITSEVYSTNVAFEECSSTKTWQGTSFAYRWSRTDSRYLSMIVSSQESVFTHYNNGQNMEPLDSGQTITIVSNDEYEQLFEPRTMWKTHNPVKYLIGCLRGKHFAQVNHHWTEVWNAIFKDRRSLFANLLYLAREAEPQETQPHALLATEVVELRHKLPQKQQECNESNCQLLEKITELEEANRQLTTKKDMLQKEVQIFRSQAARLTSGQDSINMLARDSDLPSFLATIDSYRDQKDDIQWAYSSCQDNKKGEFALALHKMLSVMEAYVHKRYNDLLEGMLVALGGLETVESASQYTRNGFDIYCRQHWEVLFVEEGLAKKDQEAGGTQRALADSAGNEVVGTNVDLYSHDHAKEGGNASAEGVETENDVAEDGSEKPIFINPADTEAYPSKDINITNKCEAEDAPNIPQDDEPYKTGGANEVKSHPVALQPEDSIEDQASDEERKAAESVCSIVESTAEKINDLLNETSDLSIDNLQATCKGLWEITVKMFLQPSRMTFRFGQLEDKFDAQIYEPADTTPKNGSRIVIVLPPIQKMDSAGSGAAKQAIVVKGCVDSWDGPELRFGEDLNPATRKGWRLLRRSKR